MSLEEKKHLSFGSKLFLFSAGIFFDGLKIGLDAFFGVGLVLDPFFITPIAALIFGITLSHNDIPVFSGKRAWASWTNLIFSFIPVLDFLPDWTTYAVYLIFAYW
ncbi:MAG TPA: hypothetical protein VMU25_02360 [Candidatus Paceibacterota bacterium]|nr:hypothetical protein [Candidatus Paceibacterota bacterium]